MFGVACGSIGEDVGKFMADTKGYDALLLERMTRLGLSPAAVDDADRNAMQHLQNTCSSCALKQHCTRDLASEQGGHASAAYCPNEATLSDLRRNTRRL
jgi:hypothetical protein